MIITFLLSDQEINRFLYKSGLNFRSLIQLLKNLSVKLTEIHVVTGTIKTDNNRHVKWYWIFFW